MAVISTMREIWSTIPPWAYVAFALLLSPVAAWLGGMWDWTVGAASLAVLSVPTCLAALTGQRGPAALTALAAGAGCTLESVCLLGHTSGTPDWGFALLSIGVLAGLSGTIIGVVEPLQRELDRLGQQSTDYLRDLFQRTRQDDRGGYPKLPDPPPPADEAADGVVNYPMLLLSLQDIGRRISTHLDIDTLVPTIVATAKGLLKCEHCLLFLWQPHTRSLLQTGTPANRREQNWCYTPNPTLGVARWVLENRHVITRPDIERDYSLHNLRDEEPQLPDAVAPLSVGGELLGLLVLHGVESDTPNFSRLLYILGNFSALALKNAQLFKRIEEMARHDGLTGLLNHASFQQQLSDLAHTALEQDRTLTVIMSDVDHFKKFNDSYGHQAGDHVLRETARLWQAVLPDYAVLARYGGEEFICVLPDDNSARGVELAEMLRSQLEAFPLHFEGQELKVTASFGVSELRRPARTAEDLVRLADEALYRAKKSGRNRVVCSQTPAASMPAPADNLAVPVLPALPIDVIELEGQP